MNDMIEKEIIYAGAIGDAFGYLVEFDSWEQIQEKYGVSGLQYHKFKNLHYKVSDDTQMTLFCWNGILNKLEENNLILENINEEIYQQYLDWYTTQHNKNYSKNYKNSLMNYQEMWHTEAPGNTCLSALNSKKMGTIERKINNSKGCGGIMRVAPISFLPIENKKIFKLGCMQAAITHGHPEGYLSAGFFASFLNDLINSRSFEEAYFANIEILKEYKEAKDLLHYLEKVIFYISQKNILKNNDLTEKIGSGWVGEEALGVALYALKKASSFSELLDISANHSGDSDSTASLAAQLYVAQNGLEKEYKQIYHSINVSSAIELLSDRHKKLIQSNILQYREENENVQNINKKVATQNNFNTSFIKTLFYNKNKK